MKEMRKAICVCTMAVLICMVMAGVAQAAVVTTLTTERQAYLVGEPVDITLTNSEVSTGGTMYVYHATIISNVDTGEIVYREYKRLCFYQPIPPGESNTWNWNQAYNVWTRSPITGELIPSIYNGMQVPTGNYKAEYEAPEGTNTAFFKITETPTAEDMGDYIQTLSDDVFRNQNMKIAFHNKLSAVQGMVDSENHVAAVNMLENDVGDKIQRWITDDDVKAILMDDWLAPLIYSLG